MRKSPGPPEVWKSLSQSSGNSSPTIRKKSPSDLLSETHQAWLRRICLANNLTGSTMESRGYRGLLQFAGLHGLRKH